MPMKPMSPESLKGLANEPARAARILDDDEVESLTAEDEEEDEDEDEEGTE